MVSVLTTFMIILVTFLVYSLCQVVVTAAATPSGDGVKKQTLNVVTLADTQQPLQQKQRSTEAAESDDHHHTASAGTRNRGRGGAVLRLDLLNHLDLLSPAELNDIDHNQVFMKRLYRDANRVSAIQAACAARRPNAGVSFSGDGDYLANLGFGTPAKGMYLILDTGSDLSWIQCKPCKSCYHQTDPIFDPKNSKTFTPVLCGQTWCNVINASCPQNTECPSYEIEYGDYSTTVGELATDILTLIRNDTISSRIAKFAFGCTHYTSGTFPDSAAGLLGLGRGPMSLPSQLAARRITSSTFSYCFSANPDPTAAPPSIEFGDNDYDPPVKTSLLHGGGNFYYLKLVGISVGGEMVAGIKSSMFEPTENGGLIIDSGTVVTRLYQPAYEALSKAFRGMMNTTLNLTSPFSLFDTCYKFPKETTVQVPRLDLHFSEGVNVSLPASNYLIPTPGNNKICFAFAATPDPLSVLGSIQQQGFRITYNTAKSLLSFTSEGC